MSKLSPMLSRSYQSITPTLGSTSDSVYANQQVLLRLCIKPATGTTQYDFEVTDQYGLIYYSQENTVGELTEVMEIPSITGLTFTISNASADEAFEVLFIFREER
jgi:hypothetical protein